MRTFDDLWREVVAILPNATFGEDNDGQLVIYTNLRELQDGTIITLTDEEEE